MLLRRSRRKGFEGSRGVGEGKLGKGQFGRREGKLVTVASWEVEKERGDRIR